MKVYTKNCCPSDSSNGGGDGESYNVSRILYTTCQDPDDPDNTDNRILYDFNGNALDMSARCLEFSRSRK